MIRKFPRNPSVLVVPVVDVSGRSCAEEGWIQAAEVAAVLPHTGAPINPWTRDGEVCVLLLRSGTRLIVNAHPCDAVRLIWPDQEDV